MGKIGFADFAYGWGKVPGMRQTHITKPCLEGTTSGWRPVPRPHRFASMVTVTHSSGFQPQLAGIFDRFEVDMLPCYRLKFVVFAECCRVDDDNGIVRARPRDTQNIILPKKPLGQEEVGGVQI